MNTRFLDNFYRAVRVGVEEKAPSFESAADSAVPDSVASDCKKEVPNYMYDGAKPAYFGPRPKNIILFGETGVGKSSVINLMAGKEVAKTSSGLQGCTLDATEHSFTIPGPTALRIFDTVGLEEPEMGVNTFMGAIVKAHQLVTSLHRVGGVDLLLFCIRGGRITSAMQRSYRLFFDILCQGKVPLAIVVTNLEQENIMEDWWVKNETTFDKYGIKSVAHACITAVSAHVTAYARKRAESQRALRLMLLDALGNPDPSYLQEPQHWFIAIVDLLKSLLMKNASFKRRDLLKKLETECKFSRSDAQRLAQMFSRRDTSI